MSTRQKMRSAVNPPDATPPSKTAENEGASPCVPRAETCSAWKIGDGFIIDDPKLLAGFYASPVPKHVEGKIIGQGIKNEENFRCKIPGYETTLHINWLKANA